jgi:hypothetical protein
MAIEIRETVVSETENATVVRMHIADAPLGDENAAFRLELTATLPRYRAPLLAQIQRQAMKAAQDALSPLLQTLANEVNANHPLNPEVR